jgi:hypothetical protein
VNDSLLTLLIRLAGLGQLALCGASLAIPRVLGWREDVAKLRPLTREVFWTYAGYIWATNLAFSLLSTFAPAALLGGSLLATAVAGFITAYWGVRVVIQLTAFRRAGAPAGLHVRLAAWALTVLFIYLTGVYGLALASNLRR